MIVYTPLAQDYPYKHDFAEPQWRAVVKMAKPSLPSAAVAACRKADKLVDESVTEGAKYGRNAVRHEYRKLLDTHSRAIAEGSKSLADLTAISEDGIEQEFAAKMVALDEVQRLAIKAARPHVIAIHQAVIKAVHALAERMEVGERVTADGFAVPFDPSQQLRLVQSVAMFLERSTPAAEVTLGEGLPRPASSLFYLDNYSA